MPVAVEGEDMWLTTSPAEFKRTLQKSKDRQTKGRSLASDSGKNSVFHQSSVKNSNVKLMPLNTERSQFISRQKGEVENWFLPLSVILVSGVRWLCSFVQDNYL